MQETLSIFCCILLIKFIIVRLSASDPWECRDRQRMANGLHRGHFHA